MAAPPRLFCFGLGYVARHLGLGRMAQGWRVAGTTRDPAKAGRLRAEGFEIHLFDRGRPLADPAAALAGTTHVLVSAPPDRDGDAVLDAHGDDLAGLPDLAWVGYLSTTGVYGDHGGGVVDEDSPRLAVSERGRRRIAAEDAWLTLDRAHGLPVHLFRLSGIYGPGRSVLDQVRAGQAKRVDKPGHMSSRIHVEDIVQVLTASMARPNPGAAYNLADDEPAPSHAVVAEACALLGTEPPPLVPFDQAELSPMARSFYADNRRVANRRIKSELDVTLRHPTYREGLRALLEANPAG